jgi:hypothetical protein
MSHNTENPSASVLELQNKIASLEREMENLKHRLRHYESQESHPSQTIEQIQRFGDLQSLLGKTLYQLHFERNVNVEFLDPRDTICRLLLGTDLSNRLYRLYRQPSFGITITTMLFVGVVSAFVSITGIFTPVGWASFCVAPSCSFVALFLNKRMVGELVKSWAFCSLAFLVSLAYGCMMYTFYHIDELYFDPARLVAASWFFVCCVTLFLYDGKMPTKKHSRSIAVGVLIACTCLIFFLCFYWAGQWQRITPTVVVIGSIKVEILSLGMSGLTGFTVILVHLCVSFVRSKEANQMVLLKLNCYYRPVKITQEFVQTAGIATSTNDFIGVGIAVLSL